LEYKTIVRRHEQDKGYNPPDDLLNEAAADGWEMIGTNMLGSIYKGAICEIFYLRRRLTGPVANPA
jgi:hypothetical protein